MSQYSHETIRTCCACKCKKNKTYMLRIVKHRDQSFEIDLHQNKPGRGSYVCKNTDCANMAWRVRGLNSSFHCRVPDEFYQKLIHFIEHHEFK